MHNRGIMKYPDDYINKIIQGDCLEVMNGIPDKSVDMILCDLPYGTTACEWDSIIPFEPLWNQYKRIIKDNGAIVLTASQPFTSALVMSNLKMFKYEWIWNKKQSGNFLLAKYQPLKITENILVFSKETTKYYPQKTKGKFRKKGGCKKESELYKSVGSNIKHNDQYYPTNILDFPTNRLYRLHPTQKPVELFAYLIKTYTNENELVLDNCIGSGTTAVACKMLNRNYIGIELSEKYCEIAMDRIENTLPLFS